MLLLLSSFLASLGSLAEVTSSDGKRYYVGTCYVAPDRLTTEFTYPDRTLRFIVSGKRGRVSSDGGETEGTEVHKRFAFAHHFHAIYLKFGTIAGSRQRVRGISFEENHYPGIRGRLPHGGVGFLVQDGDGVAGMRFELPDTEPIEIVFDQWRKTAAGELPSRLRIHHETKIYDYRFLMMGELCKQS